MLGNCRHLLNAAIPGNDIHVRTVADKIILTGTVASAEEAQKALDIASGFVVNPRRSLPALPSRSPTAPVEHLQRLRRRIANTPTKM